MSDTSIKDMLRVLKQDLENFTEGERTLDIQLESAAKHIPAYIKIVKGHIDQLADVLRLENHSNRTLETAGLAEPVIQLIDIFSKIDDLDIKAIENLAEIAKSWQFSEENNTTSESTKYFNEA